METRKVQLTGGSTYTVSLPKRWVVETGIRKNEYVGIIPQDDGSLIITPRVERSERAKKKLFEISDDAEGDHVLRKLIGAYVTGYSEIVVEMKPRLSAEVRSAVRNFSRMTIGIEITDESARKMVLRDLLNPSDLPFNKSIRRMYYITRRMVFDAVHSFTKNDQELALDVTSRDVEVDRLNWLMARQYHLTTKNPALAQSLGASGTTGINYILISRLVERIADHSCKICRNMKNLEKAKLPEKISKDVGKLGEQSVEVLDKSVEAFFGKRLDGLNDIMDLALRRIADCERLAKKVSKWGGKGAIPLSNIVESIRRIYSYVANIAEVSINHLVDASS
jgi:phosphate uptake regulator